MKQSEHFEHFLEAQKGLRGEIEIRKMPEKKNGKFYEILWTNQAFYQNVMLFNITQLKGQL